MEIFVRAVRIIDRIEETVLHQNIKHCVFNLQALPQINLRHGQGLDQNKDAIYWPCVNFNIKGLG